MSFKKKKFFARAKIFLARAKLLLILCQMLLQIDIFDLKFVFSKILNVKLNYECVRICSLDLNR
jgi:hypothetical protein